MAEMIGGGPFRLKPGEWTDDSSMALCLADSLIASGGELDPHDLVHRFVRWWRRGENSVIGRCFDIGNTTSAALANFVRTGKSIGSRESSSAGNGGIMRPAPAAIARHNDPEQAATLARAQSAVTHATDDCLDAAEVLARVLSAAISGAGVEALFAAKQADLSSPTIRGIAQGGWRGKTRAQIRSSDYVVDTLEAALWAVGSCRHSAVTGQIAGAIWGYSGIPERWTVRLARRDRLLEAGTGLWKLSAAP